MEPLQIETIQGRLSLDWPRMWNLCCSHVMVLWLTFYATTLGYSDQESIIPTLARVSWLMNTSALQITMILNLGFIKSKTRERLLQDLKCGRNVSFGLLCIYLICAIVLSGLGQIPGAIGAWIVVVFVATYSTLYYKTYRAYVALV